MAAVEMLRQGGNAVDAAVAAAFSSFVAESVLVNIGGGGIALLWEQPSKRGTFYDFFSDAPSLPLTGRSDFRQVAVDFGATTQSFYIGRASVAVPGAVAGLADLAQRHGRLPLATLLVPAIRLARRGVVMAPATLRILSLLRPIFADTSALAALFLPGGRLPQPGDRLLFPEFAATLRRLSETGPSLFYHGDVAQAIATDQATHGGLLTAEDLASYQVRRAEPIQVDYRGYTVSLPSLPSDGGVLVAFALRLLSAVDVAALAPLSAAHLRALAETMRLTNHARVAWDALDDGKQSQVGRFLGDAHVAPYRERLLDALRGGSVLADADYTPGPNHTTHISVADGNGLVVSLTLSAGENAGFVVADTGLMLNNMLGERDLHPRGFHRLSPGRRLTTMMTPTIVTRDGEFVLALGSGGSNRIRSAILQLLILVLDFSWPLAAAVAAPRVHFEGDLLQIEAGIDPQTVRQLERFGYRVNLWPDRNMFFGGTHAVARQNSEYVAAGDARRGGVALAV